MIESRQTAWRSEAHSDRQYFRRRTLMIPAPDTIWTDLNWSAVSAMDKIYVVQTTRRVIERCILMATDPGDLVLDPTCGSGTTAFVAEQWGRRWITIDTSRVALALARARIMGARYPFYLLADSREGQLKEAEITRTAPSSQPVHGNIRHGFVYERVPHITLKSIANNAEIDVIWDKWQADAGAIAREAERRAQEDSGRNGRFRARPMPSGRTRRRSCTPTGGRHASPGRRRSTPLSPPRPSLNTSTTSPTRTRRRSASPVPSPSRASVPHRVLGVDENDELIDTLKETSAEYGAKQSFPQMILENLKTAGVQQAHKEDKITFTALTAWPGELVCGEGRYLEGRREGQAQRSAPPSSSAPSSAPCSAPTSSPPPARRAMPDSMCSSPAPSTTRRTPRSSASWAASPCSRPA